MATFRFPALVWSNHQGLHTASLVEDESDAVGVGANADEALAQIEDYLQWQLKEGWWVEPPDFEDEPSLLHIAVPVRPEYRDPRKGPEEGRVYPCDEPVRLLMPTVHGKIKGGLRLCSLPTVGMHFYFDDEKALKNLVIHYVQERLKGSPPHVVMRFLAPPKVEMREIVMPAHRRASFQFPGWTPEALIQVAEPIGERRIRQLYGKAWEREREINELMRRLGPERANVILVGPGGVGKTTVLVEAIRRLDRLGEKGEKPNTHDDDDDEGIPPEARGRRHWRTGGARLIAGMQYLGQWEERTEQVISELGEVRGILSIDNLLDLTRAGGQGAGDSVAAFFVPYMQRGGLQIVAEATPAELEACRRRLPGFVDAARIMPIPPLDRASALSVLDRYQAQKKQDLKIEPEPGALGRAYALFARFAPYEAFPGRVMTFVNRLYDKARDDRETTIAQDTVVARFIEQTGLPKLFVRDELTLSHADVSGALAKEVMGQPAACDAVTSVVTTFKAGLNDPARPIGVMLFCGPTGVGKTELAKALARFLFGHGDMPNRMLRLDMSEYATQGSADRLLMDHEGGPSRFVKSLRAQPFQVVLLDEIEKAAPDVFDMLLGVFDEGLLTDPLGRATSFRSAIVIMTSNLGVRHDDGVGFVASAPSYLDVAMKFFRPEFVNRIDTIVPFAPLQADTIARVTEKELKALVTREGFEARGIKLTWTDAVVAALARTGFDVRYGARPLQRQIEQSVVMPLARFMLGRPGLANTTLELDVAEGDEVVIREKAP